MKHAGRYNHCWRCVAVTVIAALGLTATIGSGGGGVGSGLRAEFTAQPSSGPAPLEVLFDASGSEDVSGLIEWYFGDGSTHRDWLDNAVSHTYPTPGTYTVRLFVWDYFGHVASATQDITVEGSINAAFTAQPTSGPAPLEVFFDASASSDEDGIIVSYEWDFDDGQSGEDVAITHTYTTPGLYTVKLTVTNDVGAMHSATRDITVEEN